MRSATPERFCVTQGNTVYPICKLCLKKKNKYELCRINSREIQRANKYQVPQQRLSSWKIQRRGFLGSRRAACGLLQPSSPCRRWSALRAAVSPPNKTSLRNPSCAHCHLFPSRDLVELEKTGKAQSETRGFERLMTHGLPQSV